MHLNVSRCLVSILVGFASAAAPAWGAPIPISNPSFESPDTPNGTFTNAAATGWITIGGSSAGVMEGMGGLSPTPDPTDGNQNAWSNGPVYTQTLATNLAANSTYRLTMDIGDRNDTTFPSSIALDLGWGSTAGANLLTPTLSITPTPPNGGWTTWNVVFNTGAAPAGLGQPLRIDMSTVGFQAIYDQCAPECDPARVGHLATRRPARQRCT